MIYEAFEEKNFRAETRAIIETAGGIIKDYQAQGYTLTLRQLYYQFVARGIIENSERSYKNLGNAITDGRMNGLLPWDGIEDRGRGRINWRVEESLETIIGGLPKLFASDFWRTQPRHIEVWVEKEALANVVERACGQRRVPFMACKGYLSASEAWRAAKRFEDARADGKEPLVIHLGDHDPSGMDMTRDNEDRLSLLSWGEVEVHRIALNPDQVDRYKPPPNPTKITDSRAADYIERFGYTSWELDALEPSVVVSLIRAAIEPHIDHDEWEKAERRESEMRDLLGEVWGNWEKIEEMLRKGGLE